MPKSKNQKLNGDPKPEIDLTYERGMGVRVRRMTGELLLAKARGDVIPIDEVERQAMDVATVLRRQILAIGAKYARLVVGVQNEREGKRALDQIAHALCTELSHFHKKITDPNLDRFGDRLED